MNINETVLELAKIPAPAGNENRIFDVLSQKLGKYTDKIKITNGGIIADITDGDEKLPKIVLDAHIDSVGFVVTSAQGAFLRVDSLGGIDARILTAQKVIIHGKKDIRGVVCAVPPHLSKEKNKVCAVNEIFIDTCLSEETAKEYISAGDSVTFDTSGVILRGNKITSPSLDDRAGIAAILCALDMIGADKLNCRLTVALSREEEVGLRGAAMLSHEINADIAIAVDVSFAYSGGEKRSECGLLGEGAMIGFSPVLDRQLSETLLKLAQENNIPYQIEAMSGNTGTNADKYTISRGGAKGATVSVPLRYMHTPVECIDTNDIDSAARLIAAYLQTFKGEE